MKKLLSNCDAKSVLTMHSAASTGGMHKLYAPLHKSRATALLDVRRARAMFFGRMQD